MEEIPYIIEGIISHRMSRDGEGDRDREERGDTSRGEFTDRRRRMFSLKNFKNSMANIHNYQRD